MYNCFSIYYNSEIIEHKMKNFNSFTAANDSAVLSRNDRTYNGCGRRFFLPTNKTLKAFFTSCGENSSKGVVNSFCF